MAEFTVISDVHANLEALEAVLKAAEGKDVYCLGDLVDYGANPNEVIEFVREKRVRSIVGNHDVAAITGDTSWLNPRAAMGSKWTAARLTPESVEFLKRLPQELRLSLDGVEVYFTHGSPEDRLWEYVDPRTHGDLFGMYLDRTRARLMGLGHTHMPYVWTEGGRTVFNPGSVGQPRDGDRRASFASVTVKGGKAEVEVRRVEYDHQKAATKIRAAGLPESFADRLAAGS